MKRKSRAKREFKTIGLMNAIKIIKDHFGLGLKESYDICKALKCEYNYGSKNISSDAEQRKLIRFVEEYTNEQVSKKV